MPRGHFPRSPEHRANISKALRGKKKTPEHNRKNSLGQLGRQTSEETRKKLSDARIGRPGVPRTEQWLQRASIAHSGKTGLLKKYGVSLEEYQAQRSAGFRWCHWDKHWDNADQFTNRVAVCNVCKPEYGRAMNLRKMFGLDQAWYEMKLAEQGGVCAICESPDPQNKGMRFLAIDHDHKTDHIRGLLCMKCNQALERMDVYPGWALRAIAYLAQYQGAAASGLLPKAPKPFKKYIRPARRKLQDYVLFRTGGDTIKSVEPEPETSK